MCQFTGESFICSVPRCVKDRGKKEREVEDGGKVDI